jgi:hypothetical protein
MALEKQRATCHNFRGDGCMMRPGDMTDFETYLIKRIDDLESQLSDKIADVDKKVTWIYAFATGISFVVGLIINAFQSKGS